MLKVNTKKISVDDFVKKYKMEQRDFDDIFHKCFSWTLDDIILFCDCDGVETKITFGFKKDGWLVGRKSLDTMFDMIQNGDVVKE